MTPRGPPRTPLPPAPGCGECTGHGNSKNTIIFRRYNLRVADLEVEPHWCQAAFAAWRCAREVCIGACRCGIHACMLAPCMQFRKAVLRLGSSKFEPYTCSVSRELLCKARGTEHVEGSNFDHPSRRTAIPNCMQGASMHACIPHRQAPMQSPGAQR